MRPETFRRICMSFDAWIVAFGCSTVLRELRLIDGPAAYSVLAIVTAIDVVLLVRFFSTPQPASLRSTPSAYSPTTALGPS